jgi:hypothetical protein
LTLWYLFTFGLPSLSISLTCVILIIHQTSGRIRNSHWIHLLNFIYWHSINVPILFKDGGITIIFIQILQLNRNTVLFEMPHLFSITIMLNNNLNSLIFGQRFRGFSFLFSVSHLASYEPKFLRFLLFLNISSFDLTWFLTNLLVQSLKYF